MNEIFDKNFSLLIEKFPGFHPFVFSLKKEKISLPKEKTSLPKIDNADLLKKQKVLFVYGLDVPFFCSLQEKGVFEKNTPLLVVVENDPKRFQIFLKQKEAFSFLKDPRFFLEWIDAPNLEKGVRNLAEKFPFKKFLIQKAPATKNLSFFKDFEKRLTLALTIEEAYFFERAHPKPLVSSVIQNIQKLKSSFSVGETFSKKFEKIPAIICGAGPSLEADYPLLQQFSDRALIFAGGSAIPLLSNYGVFFHFALAVDPNEKEFARLKESQAFSSLFFYSLRLHSQVLSLFNPPYGYIKSTLGGFLEFFLHKHNVMKGKNLAEDMSLKALSITTLALSLALEFGCDPIIFSGVDLGFLHKKRYANGIDFSKMDQKHFSENLRLAETKKTFLKRNKTWDTHLGFVLEAEAIEEFIKNHPETTFLNASKHSLGFDPKIVPTLSLKEIENKFLKNSWDLSGYIHGCLEQKKNEIFQKNCSDSFLKNLKKSLEACQSHLSILKDEKKVQSLGVIALVETLLKEEEIFPYLFKDFERICEYLALENNQPSLATPRGKLLKLSEWIEDFLHVFSKLK